MQRTAFTIITVVRVAGGLALANAPHSIEYRPRAKYWYVIKHGKIVSNRRSISTCISPLKPPDRLSSVRGSVTPGHCSGMAGTAKAIKIGIIGGSGLDNPDLLENRQEHKVTTPFGEPSDVLISGRIGDVGCVLLARHGRQHSVMPSKVNYRANIWALKKIGCTHVIATTACGSLNDRVKPGHIVLLDQFLDRTTKRATTFYDGEKGSPKGVCHIPAATPFHEGLRQVLIKTMRAMKIEFHDAGTVVTIEGPRFSTRFESCLFRSWHCDVINMTTVPEVVLAKEAGLLYASIALVTDYDSWRLDLQHVDVTAVLETMKCNSAVALKVLRSALPNIAAIDWSDAIKEAQEEADRAVMK